MSISVVYRCPNQELAIYGEELQVELSLLISFIFSPLILSTFLFTFIEDFMAMTIMRLEKCLIMLILWKNDALFYPYLSYIKL